MRNEEERRAEIFDRANQMKARRKGRIRVALLAAVLATLMVAGTVGIVIAVRANKAPAKEPGQNAPLTTDETPAEKNGPPANVTTPAPDGTPNGATKGNGGWMHIDPSTADTPSTTTPSTTAPSTETPPPTPTDDLSGGTPDDLDDGESRMVRGDLMKALRARVTENKELDQAFTDAAVDFALSLFQTVSKDNRGENIVLSPLSALTALAMTANGARGQTLSEMEETLGNGMAIETLNAYLRSYIATLPKEEQCRLLLANAIWFKDDPEYEVMTEFLQVNADYYGADAYQMPFDEQTVSLINDWVKDKTEGMIDKILERFNGDELMVILNAVTFVADWRSPYAKEEVGSGVFHAYDGTEQEARYLAGEEQLYCFTDGEATKEEKESGHYHRTVGFLKEYKGGYDKETGRTRFCFAVILPEEGVDVYDYLASLTPEKLTALFGSAERHDTVSSFPKFECSFDTRLNGALAELGMPTAFNGGADFSGIAEGDLFLQEVAQSARIIVDEEGTRATAVTVATPGYSSIPDDLWKISVDRPFIYMIVDTVTDLPVFVGVTASV